jgi:L-aminopeptidase/D-esterase-like protein
MTELIFDETLTVVRGIEVGHATDLDGLTGVTVVVCRDGGIGGVCQRGGAIGGRQLSALDPAHIVDKVQGFVLCGGSAFGMAAADGVMRSLAAQSVGFDVGGAVVPILPTAVIFDLKVGDETAWPDADMGARALVAASAGPVIQGCVGAGTGASVGKLLGIGCATKGGLGSAGLRRDSGQEPELEVGALAVVNAFGDVRDPSTDRLVAGARLGPDSRELADTLSIATTGQVPERFGDEERLTPRTSTAPENTTLAVVATNARLDAQDMTLVARLAADAFPRTIAPACTRFDGDLVFAITTGQVVADAHQVGLCARLALEQSILRAVRQAEPLGGLPVARDLRVRE